MLKGLTILLIAILTAGCAAPAPAAVTPSAPTQPAAEITAQPSQPAWAPLGLKGSLLLILRNATGPVVARMSLETGAIAPLYQAQDGALLSTALASPDGKQILLTYAPPATAENQMTYTSLYLMPADGSAPPHPLFSTSSDVDAYFAPTWAPDGQAIYTSHYHKGSDPNGSDARFSIDRVSLDGKTQEVIKDAMWPRLSPDGSQIAYVSSTPANTQNDLYLSDLHGQHITPPVKPGAYPAIDDHFFTPDGKAILFSAVNLQPTPTPTLLERLLGVEVVSAHNVPSDWYRVNLADGSIQRLTQLEDTGMYASLSPHKDRVAFISATGIYVMNLDGSNLTQLTALVATGTVDWVP